MIIPASRKLNFWFTAVILGFNLIFLLFFWLYAREIVVDSVRGGLERGIQRELIPAYNSEALNAIGELRYTEYFQVLNQRGQVMAATYEATRLETGLNQELFEEAKAGNVGYHTIRTKGVAFLVAYFKLDSHYIGRAAAPLNILAEFQRKFLVFIIFALPAVVVVTFFMGQYLVTLAMGPVASAMDYQETFSEAVSHELMTPLTSLKGNMEVTLRKPREAMEYKTSLGEALEDTDRIISLLNNLKLLSSTKFTSLELFQEEVDLGDILRQAFQPNLERLEEKKVVLDLESIGQLECFCDRTLIKRTLENLVENATKYTPPGGKIALTGEKKGKKVVLTCQNTCVNLNHEDRESLFRPFQRGDNTSQNRIEGKGLGLFVSRHIARAHQGDLVIADSEPNLFRITLTLPTG